MRERERERERERVCFFSSGGFGTVFVFKGQICLYVSWSGIKRQPINICVRVTFDFQEIGLQFRQSYRGKCQEQKKKRKKLMLPAKQIMSSFPQSPRQHDHDMQLANSHNHHQFINPNHNFEINSWKQSSTFFRIPSSQVINISIIIKTQSETWNFQKAKCIFKNNYRCKLPWIHNQRKQQSSPVIRNKEYKNIQ